MARPISRPISFPALGLAAPVPQVVSPRFPAESRVEQSLALAPGGLDALELPSGSDDSIERQMNQEAHQGRLELSQLTSRIGARHENPTKGWWSDLDLRGPIARDAASDGLRTWGVCKRQCLLDVQSAWFVAERPSRNHAGS